MRDTLAIRIALSCCFGGPDPMLGALRGPSVELRLTADIAHGRRDTDKN